MPADDTDTLKARVARWFAKSGYPLEMEVAALVASRGFAAYRSEYYLDRDSGDAREIDVVAMLGASVESGKFRLTAAIECKTSREKPWVVLTTPSQTSDDVHITDRAASKAGIEFLTRVASRADVQQLPIFHRPARAGYSVIRAMAEDNQDVPYKAMMSAAKAARSLAWEASGIWRKHIVAEVVLPVVVIDGEMFECYLDDDGTRVLSETDRQVVYWRNPVAGQVHTVITVTTLRALPEYLDEVADAFDTLHDLCASDLDAALVATRATLPVEPRPA